MAFEHVLYLYLYLHLYLYFHLYLWNLHFLNDEVEVVPAGVSKQARVEGKGNQGGILHLIAGQNKLPKNDGFQSFFTKLVARRLVGGQSFRIA